MSDSETRVIRIKVTVVVAPNVSLEMYHAATVNADDLEPSMTLARRYYDAIERDKMLYAHMRENHQAVIIPADKILLIKVEEQL